MYESTKSTHPTESLVARTITSPSQAPDNTSSSSTEYVNKHAKLPMSTQDYEVLPYPSPYRTKCICGQRNGGIRIPEHKKEEWVGPHPYFDKHLGAWVSHPEANHYFSHVYKRHRFDFRHPGASTMPTPIPFKLVDAIIVDGSPHRAGVLVDYTAEDLAKGIRRPLSREVSVPKCAHFPVTGDHWGLLQFKAVGRYLAMEDGRTIDQAYRLCFIEDSDVNGGNRRMSIHTPPSDWTDQEQITILNKWRTQFRNRKRRQPTREKRQPWSEEQKNYLINEMASMLSAVPSGDLCRASISSTRLADMVSEKFAITRTSHGVECFIARNDLLKQARDLARVIMMSSQQPVAGAQIRDAQLQPVMQLSFSEGTDIGELNYSVDKHPCEIKQEERDGEVPGIHEEQDDSEELETEDGVSLSPATEDEDQVTGPDTDTESVAWKLYA